MAGRTCVYLTEGQQVCERGVEYAGVSRVTGSGRIIMPCGGADHRIWCPWRQWAEAEGAQE